METVGTKFVGTKILLTGTFTTAGSSTAADPATVTANIRKPDGTYVPLVYGVNAEVTRLSAGVYELRYVLNAKGRWWFGFAGSGGTSTPVVVEEVCVIALGRSTVAA